MPNKEISMDTAPGKVKNYNGIDVVKFLCSILVVAIHIPVLNGPYGGELSSAGEYTNMFFKEAVCRIGVPFFFVCSGFLLFDKMPAGTLDVDRVKRYCFKMLRLFGMWSTLLFIGTSEHLWYLRAAVVGITFLSICTYYRMGMKWLVMIACVFYGLGLLEDSYYGLLEPLISGGLPRRIYIVYDLVVATPRNGLFMGYIFVLIGYLFARYKIRIKTPAALTGFLVSLLCLCAEALLVERYGSSLDNNMYLSLLPAAFFLFAFALSLSLRDRPIYSTLRTMGVLVYFLHMFINVGIGFVKKVLHKVLNFDIQPFQFFITLSVTLLIAFGIDRLSRKERFQWLRWFLS